MKPNAPWKLSRLTDKIQRTWCVYTAAEPCSRKTRVFWQKVGQQTTLLPGVSGIWSGVGQANLCSCAGFTQETFNKQGSYNTY